MENLNDTKGLSRTLTKRSHDFSYDASKENYHFSLEEIKDFFAGDIFLL